MSTTRSRSRPNEAGARGTLCFGDDGSVPPWRALFAVVSVALMSFFGVRGWLQGRQVQQGEDRSAELRSGRANAGKMGALAQRLEQVDALEERLRELAQLSDPGRRLAIGPVDDPDSKYDSPWGDREHPLLRQARSTS